VQSPSHAHHLRKVFILPEISVQAKAALSWEASNIGYTDTARHRWALPRQKNVVAQALKKYRLTVLAQPM
jgi:hypothetical protein